MKSVYEELTTLISNTKSLALEDALRQDGDVRSHPVTVEEIPAVKTRLAESLDGLHGPLKAARAHWILADLFRTLERQRADGREEIQSALDALLPSSVRHHEEEAFREICRAVDLGVPSPVAYPRLRINLNEEVYADAPARLDFVGGWSDTPPYSLEHGGAVLNVALLLDGHRPVRAWVRPLPSPVLRFGSKDLGQSVTLTRLSEALAYQNPRDPFALHKAAVALMGIVTAEGGPLSRQMERFGGGLELVTESAVPKGSGLGTSSILGGVALAALGKAVGVELGALELFDLVLALEQRMTTGGGWQDQIGGLMGGWKVTRTGPGLRQTPSIEPLALEPAVQEQLNERALLLYSGYTRLAKNILRNFVSQYLSRDAVLLDVLHSMRPRVDAMAGDLRAGDLDRVGAAMDRNNDAVASVDPHSWPPHIASLVESIRPHLCGAKPAGAGGGGFLILMTKSAEDRRKAEAALSRLNLPDGARTYPLQVSKEGLRVTVREKQA
ncbi:MAG: hypothetical protein KY468_01995 [Armatimonadetes bacterium]|nr:hypothetical protein [Armatimonadota bacterium]